MSPTSGWGSGNTIERRVTDLERKQRATAAMAGIVASMGTFSLTNDGVATSTLVTDAKVSATSHVRCTPTNSGGYSVDGAFTNLTKGAGSFTVTHSASTLTRSYEYQVINAA